MGRIHVANAGDTWLNSHSPTKHKQHAAREHINCCDCDLVRTHSTCPISFLFARTRGLVFLLSNITPQLFPQYPPPFLLPRALLCMLFHFEIPVIFSFYFYLFLHFLIRIVNFSHLKQKYKIIIKILYIMSLLLK